MKIRLDSICCYLKMFVSVKSLLSKPLLWILEISVIVIFIVRDIVIYFLLKPCWKSNLFWISTLSHKSSRSIVDVEYRTQHRNMTISFWCIFRLNDNFVMIIDIDQWGLWTMAWLVFVQRLSLSTLSQISSKLLINLPNSIWSSNVKSLFRMYRRSFNRLKRWKFMV